MVYQHLCKNNRTTKKGVNETATGSNVTIQCINFKISRIVCDDERAKGHFKASIKPFALEPMATIHGA
eukprot:6115515-Amphidinium_carterae.1